MKVFWRRNEDAFNFFKALTSAVQNVFSSFSEIIIRQKDFYQMKNKPKNNGIKNLYNS
jgi:hypothetical protein